jgi:hypothetical protein
MDGRGLSLFRIRLEVPMIVLHSFNEAHQLFQQKRIPFRLLQDQAAVLLSYCQQTYRPIDNALEVTDDDIAWVLRQPESGMRYVDVLGGNVYIAEEEVDLLQVEGCDFDFSRTHGRWPNICEVPLAFDDCKYLQEKSSEAQWVLFLTCWNDAGGSVFYLPRSLWQAARVTEHKAATDGFWQGGE